MWPFNSFIAVLQTWQVTASLANRSVGYLAGEDRHHDVLGQRVRGDDDVRLVVVRLRRKRRLKLDVGDSHELRQPGEAGVLIENAEARLAGGRGSAALDPWRRRQTQSGDAFSVGP